MLILLLYIIVYLNIYLSIKLFILTNYYICILSYFKITGIFWFDIFLVLVKNMSNQKIPVKSEVLNSSLYSIVIIKQCIH